MSWLVRNTCEDVTLYHLVFCRAWREMDNFIHSSEDILASLTILIINFWKLKDSSMLKQMPLSAAM